MTSPTLARGELIDQLSHYGIEGTEIYFLDLIPLLEMAWADEQTQENEITLINAFMKQHISRTNLEAGRDVVDEEKGRAFLKRFLHSRPDPELLKTLRGYLVPLRLQNEDTGGRRVYRELILAACLDVAACCVRQYPYDMRDRFDAAEKRCLFDILDTFYSI